jgi:hypothetical protein
MNILGFSVMIVCTYSGGKLWGSKYFCRCLFEEAHVIVEPTGGKNSAANGKAECAIGILGVQAQLLFYAASLKPIFGVLPCYMQPTSAILNLAPMIACLPMWNCSILHPISPRSAFLDLQFIVSPVVILILLQRKVYG